MTLALNQQTFSSHFTTQNLTRTDINTSVLSFHIHRGKNSEAFFVLTKKLNDTSVKNDLDKAFLILANILDKRPQNV